MNIPSPFQQRPSGQAPSGVDSKSMLPGGAKPITPGAPPVLPDAAPVPAPVTPAASPSGVPAAAPFGSRQVAPARPSPGAQTPTPAATPAQPVAPPQPQMVPAYVAKAMEKQAEREAKENALVPAPAPGATPAPTRQEAPAQPAGAVAATTTTATDTRSDVTPDQLAAEQSKLGEVNAANAEEQARIAALTPAATDTPAQVADKAATVAKDQQLRDMATQWLTAKEDPAFVRLFNQTMLDTAIGNQAAIDATKRAIAQNPSLAGQPAGDAMLGLKAIQLGMELSDLKANLSIEHARAVAKMNKDGFDALYQLNRDKMTQDEKDIETYGTVMDRMISSGASDEELKAYYDRTIKPLLGDKDITFDQFRSPAERQSILSGVQNDGLEQMREALDRGDTPGALAALEAAYAPAKQIELGNALIAANDIATINGWLKDAGYEEIDSMADLIGREDDVFIAEQISKGKTKNSESGLQPKVDAMLRVLQGRGMDITDPDVIDAVEEYLYQQEFGDPEEPNVLPWDSDATSWKYKDWEIFDPATGRVLSDGDEFYDEQDNPEPAVGSAEYNWRNALDNAWQKYLVATPRDQRLSRDDWFAEFKTKYTGSGKPVDEFLVEWKPGSKKVEIEDRPAAINEGKRLVSQQTDVTKIDFTDPNVAAYFEDLPALLPAQIGNAETFAKGKIGEWVRFGDKYYRVDAGAQQWYSGSQNEKRHRDYMTLTGQDGKTLYVGSDGRSTTTPPPTGKGGSGRDAFKAWYNSMKAA